MCNHMNIRYRAAVAASSIRNAFQARRPQVSLITDFGIGDEAAYAVKSAIHAVNPRAVVDEICHNVPVGNIIVGASRLRRAVMLPTERPGTVYVAVVDPGVGTSRKDIIVKTKTGKYLVGPDNGVLSLAFSSEGVERAVEVENPSLTLLHLAHSRTFRGKDVFAPVAGHLLRGVPISEFGRSIDENDLARISISCETSEKGRAGYIVDVDGFGSIRTNVPNHLPESVIGTSVDFVIHGKRTVSSSATVARTFSDVEKGEPALVLSSTGCLDLAVNLGSASERYGIRAEDIGIRNSEPDTRISLSYAQNAR